jgi:hypothetical protein
VHDITGGVVPGAIVTAKHIETGLTRTVETSINGDYKMPSLPVGEFEVNAEKPGFRQQFRRGIHVAVAQEAAVDFTLDLGNVAQSVTVRDEVPIVNATLNPASGLITEQQIKELPLNGRSFDQLLTLNVGTIDNRANISNNAWTAFSVAGKRPETNRFLLNGIDFIGSNSSGQFITPSGSSGQLLGVDAIREYNVLQHTYGAEYGKRAGAQVTIVASSGTNQWHGDLFEYLRNSVLDARNFFDQTRGAPPFQRNQFGGAVGGPLKKNRAFVFGNYEGFRDRLALPGVAIVPDTEARKGLLPNASGVYEAVPNLEPRMLPYANTFWPVPSGPEILINGLPSGTAYAYSSSKRKIREDFGLTRFDYTYTNNDAFNVSFAADAGSNATPAPDPVFIQHGQQRAYVFGLQETHIVSAKLVNVATLGFSRAWADQVVIPTKPIPSSLVFLTGTNPGTILVTGFTTAGGNSPSWHKRNHYTWADDVRINQGRQLWSFGMWIQRVQQNPNGVPQGTAGQVSYLTLLAFLQDQPNQFVANPNPQALYFRSTEGAWYVQNEIKIKPHFTLRLGLRDEMTNGWTEAHGHASNYVYDANGTIITQPRIGSSALLENNSKALWQPRVGLAWDPTGAGTWAVRAGFGIHHDLQDNLAHRLNINPPFNARLAIMNTPLFSIIPIPFGTSPPPSCSAQSALRPPDCSIFSPGGIDPTMKTPTVQQWSLTVERGIKNDLMLELSYVGSESYHIVNPVNKNVARPQLCSDATGCVSGGIRAASQVVRVPQGTTYIPSTPNMRPNPFVGSTLSWFYNGTSSYHSANVSLIHRSAAGLTLKANYTFSKILDINSAILSTSATNEPAGILNPFDLKLSKGLASFNLKHQFNVSFLYPLPIRSGRRLAGGWQWSGVLNIQSGFPFTPLVGSNTSGTGDAPFSDVPNRNPDFDGPVVLGKPGQWFDARAFLIPLAGTFGNVSRGSFTGPALWSFDTSLAKKFSVTERVSLRFRAEVFNVFNHPNFASPNAVVFSGNNYSASAGVVTQTATASRQIQFALKTLF